MPNTILYTVEKQDNPLEREKIKDTIISNGYEIVKEYSDVVNLDTSTKSKLGLKELISDITSGRIKVKTLHLYTNTLIFDSANERREVVLLMLEYIKYFVYSDVGKKSSITFVTQKGDGSMNDLLRYIEDEVDKDPKN